ncbi:nucleotidyltransferase family protein [Massilia sp. ST3]|uniref:nucleotidyltransferase domain-containing protein n=1 Tax=Massilia sp. ST3 TaxID=2824903 RepID=UPI001B83E8AC|nr:nucleotidyltransferase family protein [Massilia sp. ST3]MBQ5948162.1 nucleotidyltransferase family protein [Massilia sp. ST3]
MSMPLLLQLLRDPRIAARLAPGDWDLLLRQAANAGMGATVLALLEDGGLLDTVPSAPRAHLEWWRVAAERHACAVRFEVARIREALDELQLPVILLKGAAYALAELPAGRGRVFSDIDILLPKAAMGKAEAALMLHGWATTHHDAYDQRYYRQWMHELPPMIHMHRGNAIDVHHAILPETAPARPDPAKLRAAAVALPGEPGLWTLCPHDMFLHSAVHLFWGGEFNHGLRDLFDLHRLALHFGARPGFWDGLAARAAELELARPLFYALRWCVRLLDTPVPPAVLAQAAGGRPKGALMVLMDALFARALLPLHPSCGGRAAALAHFALYVRGNWLRMPPLLLSRHLFHKAFLSPKAAEPV